MASTIEIVFKGRRLDYFVNPDFVPFSSGDDVIVEAERGIDMGRVAHLDVDVAPPSAAGGSGPSSASRAPTTTKRSGASAPKRKKRRASAGNAS